ncbi:NADP-dependent 3-hydroxy acid dehydrogenase YdfG [Motilibacter rhizosphaerae]|uniref:NADP-dependent 3-hydroxy acid dehydrogenase YdfG n=1 Tax=Motilibacter rhizosphaerae TaxID=598652 RepID=A0A4Q7NAW0_9ACTN|nr:SDR family NAD(P)-dependent oxidoreductase [Motilibacter rhizosphaerae]RZS79940.1 NADP-dependent 3-hydroxy acid dehydrogenase YdfG [Motilibacter rhizosphaerae]
MDSFTVLITGATSGIGLETARQLTATGATVLVGARDPDRGASAAAEVGGTVLALDVTDAASIAAAAERVPHLDALVNNAGVSLEDGPLTATGIDVFRRTYETNVFGVVAATNAFLPALLRSPAARIVNVSSGTGSIAWSTGPNPQFDHGRGAWAAAYRSSKTALNALTVLYAQALADDGIKVNALAPGLRATGLNAAAARSGGDPAEAAAAVVRLARLPEDGPTGGFFSWDGTEVPW